MRVSGTIRRWISEPGSPRRQGELPIARNIELVSKRPFVPSAALVGSADGGVA